MNTSKLTQLPHKNESSSRPSVGHTNLCKIMRLSNVNRDRNGTKLWEKLTLRDDTLYIHDLSEDGDSSSRGEMRWNPNLKEQ